MGYVVTGRDRAAIAAIEAELGVLRLGDPPSRAAIPVALAAVRELLDVETAMVYSLQQRTHGWAVDRWDVVGPLAAPSPRALIDALFESEATDPVLYDPLRPAPDIRDRVFEAGAWVEAMGPGRWKSSRTYREFFEPLRMFEHQQLRALVCEGPTLLGWFGIVHPDPTAPRDTQVLSSLLPAMRRRLSLERRLDAAERTELALEAALDQLGSAAYVISGGGAIHEANPLGRALLETQRREILAAITDALAHRANPIEIELAPVRQTGAAACWLAIVRAAPSHVRISAAVGAAAVAWRLTGRQRQVLDLVVRGHANAAIAAQLAVTPRTIELHVSLLLARADAISRSALVARVLA